MTMTGEQIRALVEDKDPADLTPEECAALREAVRTSPEVLRELADRIQIEEYLARVLGRPQVSVERVLERLARRRAHAIGAQTRYGLVVCALVGAVLVTLFLTRGWRGRRAPIELARQVAEEQPAAVVEESPSAPAEPTAAAAAQDPALQPPLGKAVAETAPAEPAPPEPTPPQPAPPEPATPAAIATTPLEPLREAGLFAPMVADDRTPDDKALDRWLATVEAVPLKLSSQPIEGTPCGRFEGLARLRRPLVEGAALRVASPDFEGLRIHVWSGARGVTLDAFKQPLAWVAFATTRPGTEPLPTGYETVGRDDGRMIRTNPVGVQRIELRYADGTITLARGDVRVVEAPLDGPPTEVFFEGAAVFREIAMVAAAPIPPLRSPSTRPAADLLAGSQDAWVRGGDQTAGFTVHRDGTATLSAVDTKQPAWAVLPLPAVSGLREIVVRIEGVTPGTGLVLADGKAAPQSVLRFLANKNAPGVVQLDRKSPGDNALESPEPLAARPFTFVGETVWLRLRQCGGGQRLDTSGDGRNWVIGGGEPQPPFEAIGLHLVPHASARSITVTALDQAEFLRLESLAPAELRESAVELPPQGPFTGWLAAADAAKPPAADTAAWRRACALKALAGGAAKDLAIDLLGFLWRESLADEMPKEARLDLLDDILALAPVVNEPAAATRIASLFTSLGASLAAAGEPRCFSAISHDLATAPLRSGEPFVAFPESLARREILGLLAGGECDAVRRLGERLAFYGFSAKPSNDLFFSWADAFAASRLAGTPPQLAAEWRHPLVVDPGKESLSVQVELAAALADEEWVDVCRLIDAAAADVEIDLLADRTDPELLVSLPVAVATAMQDTPRLRAAMLEGRERIAGLRLLEATATGNPAAVDTMTVQFHGTAAAAEGHVWLGDRSLAAGRFAAARRHYEAAAPAIPPSAQKRAQQTAAAIDLAHRLGVDATTATPGASLPASDSLVATPVARLEGDVGGAPAGLPAPLAQGGIDWPPHAIDQVARQLAVLPLADRLLVSNRFQLASHDAATGTVQWRAGLGGDAANAHDWPGHPMRPVADAERAYVRRLRKAGPAVAGVALADGKVAWELVSSPDRQFVSDPLRADGNTLVVCAARAVEGSYQLSLVTLDAVSGQVVAEAPLVTLGSGWWAIRDCQLVAADGIWIVVAGGSVIACDDSGRVRWVRRDAWLPPAVDAFWMLVSQGSTLVHDGRVHVVQPGVPGLVALDVESGRVRWRFADPAVSRIRGLAQGRIIVERIGALVSVAGGGLSMGGGPKKVKVRLRNERVLEALTAVGAGETGDLLALDATTGTRVWRFGPVDLLDASLVADDGLLVAVRTPVAGKNARVAVLVRLDPATGQAAQRWPLAACEDPQPFLGPLVPTAGGLRVFFGRGAGDATRDLLRLEQAP
jgi:outer membrane protein assembly factor BamB